MKFEKGNFEGHYYITVGGQEVGQFTIIRYEESDERYLERLDIDEPFRNAGLGTKAFYKIADEFGAYFFAPDNEGCQRLAQRIASEYRGEDAPYIDQGFGVYEIN